MKSPFDTAVGTIISGILLTFVLYFIVRQLVIGG